MTTIFSCVLWETGRSHNNS